MSSPQPTFQFSLRTLFVLTAIASFLLAGYVLWNHAMKQFFHDVLVGETGPVESCSDWPDPLRALVEKTNGLEIDQSTIRVYCLCQGFDPVYVWRMDVAPGSFEHIRDRWKLTQVTNPNWPILEGRSSISGVATPPWWTPKDDGSTSFFVCPQTLAGEKGDRFLVALDTRRNTIFVHYWFNF